MGKHKLVRDDSTYTLSMSDSGPDYAGYTDWKQVAGYFDGDGCVIIKVRKFVLIFYLQWVDTYRPQLQQVSSFIKGLETSKGIYPVTSQDAFSFRITRMNEVLSSAERIVPWSFKKREELQVAIEYYRNMITGNAAAKVMNDQVLGGRRSGRLIEVNLPFTHEEGTRLARRRSGLSEAQLDEIRRLYESSHSSSYALGRKYGVSATTIRNILKDR